MLVNLFKIKKSRIYLFLVILTFILYGNSINNEYAIDDNIVVEGNQLVAQGLKAIPKIFKSRYATGKQEYEYRPMVTASFAVEKQFFSKFPEKQTKLEKKRKDKLTQANISHFFNVLIYAVSCIILYILLTKIFKDYNLLLPLVVTLLFLVHPLHTEAVSNIKSRDELFMLLGVLFSLIWFVKYSETNHYKYILYAIFAILFAFLSKRNALMIFGLAPIVLYFMKVNLKKIGTVVLSMVIILIVFMLIKKSLLAGKSTRDLLFFENPLFYQGTWLDRLTVALYCSWFYLEMLIFPLKMSFYYGYNQIPMANFSNWQVWAGLLFFIPIGVYGFLKFIKREILGLGIIIWFGVMLGVNNILFPIVGIVADRFTYAFSIGFCIVLGFLLLQLFKIDLNPEAKQIKISNNFLMVFILVSVIYSGRTIARNPDWHDYLTLYNNDIEHLAESAKAHALISNTMYPLTAQEMQKNPNNPQLFQDVQKIIYHYKEAIRIDSTYVTSVNNLGSVYVNFLKDYKTAIPYCEKAVEMDSNYLEAHFNLAYAYQSTQNFEKSLQHYVRVLEINPDYSKAYTLLTQLLNENNKTNEGIEVLKGIALKVENPKNVYVNIANLYSLNANGDYSISIKYFEKAYELDKTDKVLCNHIAKLYQFSGNTQQANEYLSKCK